MITGLYSAASNLDALTQQQDAIAGNIANAGVSGHKGETVVFRSFPDLLFTRRSSFIPPETSANRTTGRMGTGVGVDWAYLNFEPGILEETGVPTDLTVDGDGFFVVRTERGERLTRNSKFKITIDENRSLGTITTVEGYPLLGQRGPIQIPVDRDFKVDKSGTVAAGDQILDRIRLVTVPDKNVLKPESGALFHLEEKWADDLEPAREAAVQQGYVERSNVNTLVEMVRMIESFRNFESAARVLTALDQTLNLAVNEIGRRV